MLTYILRQIWEIYIPLHAKNTVAYPKIKSCHPENYSIIKSGWVSIQY